MTRTAQGDRRRPANSPYRVGLAYRGHLIRSSWSGLVWVEREGFCLSYARDEADARRIIEQLTEEEDHENQNHAE